MPKPRSRAARRLTRDSTTDPVPSMVFLTLGGVGMYLVISFLLELDGQQFFTAFLVSLACVGLLHHLDLRRFRIRRRSKLPFFLRRWSLWSRDTANPTCPLCHDLLEELTELTTCPACGVQTHMECGEELADGCPTLGCGTQEVRSPKLGGKI